MAFPASLDNFTPHVDDVDEVMAADINELQAAIEAIEAKIGIDDSADTDSIDYILSTLAPLVSPSFTTPDIGAATGVSLSLAGAGVPMTATNNSNSAAVQGLAIKGARSAPAANDSVYASLYLNSSASVSREVARITAYATSVTNGAEDAAMMFYIISGGSLVQKMNFTNDQLAPASNDSLALGMATVAWSDLFLASGAVINFNNGNLILTHNNTDTYIRLNPGDLRIATAGTNAESVVTNAGTQSLSNKTLTGVTTLADNGQIDLTLPTTNGYATGPVTDSINAGYSSAVGDLVYLGSSGKWLLADADAASTSKGLLAIALEAKTDGQAMKVALPGSFVYLTAWNWSAPSLPLYVGETPGAMQEANPTGGDAVIRVAAHSVTADIIYFMPDPGYQTVVA